MTNAVLAIDQGTTSTRAMLFSSDYSVLGTAQIELAQHYPRSGWVEHDPDEIWQAMLATARQAIAAAEIQPTDIAAIGITNQRETTLVWDRRTGRPIHPAIVWQDRRTAEHCARLRSDGAEPIVREKTGLLLDPYFSATKIAWLLDSIAGAREAAEQGHLAFGTIDSYLVWRLTGGTVHTTDATNASRTLLYDIAAACWDRDLCDLFSVPMSLLPDVRNSADDFGTTDPALFGAAIAIGGIAGDQQAATIGQACLRPGMLKSTYGTGCFALLNTGETLIRSQNRLLTTIAYRIDGRTTYALEGSIFIAGAAVQWLRDGLGIIETAAQSGELAATADAEQAVYLVPAFVGLGAPYWDSDCRGAMFGLTRNTGPAELARAALESVCFQTRDLLEAMQRDVEQGWPSAGQQARTILRVDGGMVASDWTMQRLADILAAPVDRPTVRETTAFGAAYLAGRQAGVYPDLEDFAAQWSLDRRFDPAMVSDDREKRYRGWQDAVARTLSCN